MKKVALQYFWWPRISKETEQIDNSCEWLKEILKKTSTNTFMPMASFNKTYGASAYRLLRVQRKAATCW